MQTYIDYLYNIKNVIFFFIFSKIVYIYKSYYNFLKILLSIIIILYFLLYHKLYLVFTLHHPIIKIYIILQIQ